jgi:hypothetical protein
MSFQQYFLCIFFLKFKKTIECSFKFLLYVALEESIVNAPLISLQSKKTNDAKIRLDLNS